MSIKTDFNDLLQGYIYLVKGTLNQFGYEVSKLNNVKVIIEPDWIDIQQTISSNSIFIEHTYLVVFCQGKIPVDLFINESKCYTLFILASNFNGELTDHKKIFKSCHKPYFSLDILSKVYFEELQVSKELTSYFNLNPKLQTDIDISNRFDNSQINVVELFLKGDLSIWVKSNRNIFYKYILNSNSSIHNFTPVNKPPYGIPISLWLLFISYSKYKSRLYNLHPEYLIKVFAVWVYLTRTYYKDKYQQGLTSFVNKRDGKTYYSFATSEQALIGLKKITKKC